jgi:hypothetical protein
MNVKELAKAILPGSPVRLAVKFPVDLRMSIDMKLKECSPFAPWTAFINNAGTLAHVMHREDDLLVRLPIRPSCKNYDMKFQHKLVAGTLSRRFRILE